MSNLSENIECASRTNDLLNQGWKYLEFYFDFDYLNKVGGDKVFKHSIIFLGEIAEDLFHPHRNIFSNITSLFTLNAEEKYNKWVLNLIPNPLSYSYNNLYIISSVDNGTLPDIIIDIIFKKLNRPISIHQSFESRSSFTSLSTSIFLTYPVEKYISLEDLDYSHLLFLTYKNNIMAKKEKIKEFSDRGKIRKTIYFPTTELRDYYVNLACQNLAIFKTKTQTVFGECNSKYLLSSFTNTDLTKEATTKVKAIEQSSKSAKLAMLLTGAPGTAKTSWANAFVKEVISPLGYLTINLDLESLSEFTPPDYVNKVCLVINDGDNLALSRESRTDGFTEKVMGLLDGNQVNCITPFNNSNLKLIIIITANTTERWDKAALRQGRIDIDYKFTEKAYIE